MEDNNQDLESKLVDNILIQIIRDIIHNKYYRIAFAIIIFVPLIISYNRGYYNQTVNISPGFIPLSVEQITRADNTYVLEEPYSTDDFYTDTEALEFEARPMGLSSEEELIMLYLSDMQEVLIGYSDLDGLQKKARKEDYIKAKKTLMYEMKPNIKKHQAYMDLWASGIFDDVMD